MICILSIDPMRQGADTITGWIIATDLADATRQAYAAGAHELAHVLYRMDNGLPITPGKHRLPTGHVLIKEG